jgi:glycosyltransferase involved in cell wall biosynthesis
MNILFVTDFYKPHIGGVEKLFSSLAEELVKKGNSVTFITWRYEKKLLPKEDINGVKVIRVPSPARMLFSISALFRIIKNARHADIIHTSTYSSAIGTFIASRLIGKKIIITVHEVWGDLWSKMPFLTYSQKRFFRLFERWLLKLKFDQYIAVSNFTQNKILEAGINSEKIIQIYNGIENNFPKWSDPGRPFTFCFFGRAGTSKGLDILLDAAEILAKTNETVRFKFILSPQMKKVYTNITQRITQGILSKVSTLFTHLPQELLYNELGTSNCVIIPSLCEGFGFTAAEASAMEIPIISSGMGSLPEVVSGNVITMEDYNAQQLVVAMRKALAGKFNVIEEKQFPITEFIEKHTLLYKKIIT